MAASRMCQGVSKSGSPMPSEITSFIFATISKKSRMPERGRSMTCLAMNRVVSIGTQIRNFKFENGSRRTLEPVFVFSRHIEQKALFLVGAQQEMRGGGKHAFDGGQFFGHERRDFLQARPADEHEQIVTTGHEIA